LARSKPVANTIMVVLGSNAIKRGLLAFVLLSDNVSKWL